MLSGLWFLVSLSQTHSIWKKASDNVIWSLVSGLFPYILTKIIISENIFYYIAKSAISHYNETQKGELPMPVDYEQLRNQVK